MKDRVLQSIVFLFVVVLIPHIALAETSQELDTATKVKYFIVGKRGFGLSDTQLQSMSEQLSPAVPEMLRYLKRGNSRERRNAAYILKFTNDSSTIPALLNALDDREQSVVSSAEQTLRALADESNKDYFVEALEESLNTYWEQLNNWHALADSGHRPEKIQQHRKTLFLVNMVGWLGCSDWHTISTLFTLAWSRTFDNRENWLALPYRREAVKALVNIGEKAKPAIIDNFKKDPRSSVLLRLVGLLHIDELTDDIIAVADDGPTQYRPALFALGLIGTDRALAALEKLFEKDCHLTPEYHDSNFARAKPSPTSNRFTILPAIAMSDNPQAESLIMRLVDKYAVDTGGKSESGSNALFATPAYWEPSGAHLREWAVLPLGLLGAYDSLAKIIESTSENASADAALALAYMNDKRALPRILSMLGDEQYGFWALRAAGRIPDERFVPVLLELLKNSTPGRSALPTKSAPSPKHSVPTTDVVEALKAIFNCSPDENGLSHQTSYELTEKDKQKYVDFFTTWWEQNKNKTRAQWLIEDLKSNDHQTVEYALLSLGNGGYREAVPSVIALLQNAVGQEESYIARYAADALAKMGDASVLPVIKDAANKLEQTESWWPPLIALGDKEAVDYLIDDLKQSPAENAFVLKIAVGYDLGGEDWAKLDRSRDAKIAEVKKWWAENKKTIDVKPVPLDFHYVCNRDVLFEY